MSRPITMSDSITTNVCIIKSKSNYSWQRCFLIVHRVHRRMFNVDQATFFLCSLSVHQANIWLKQLLHFCFQSSLDGNLSIYTLFDILLTILFALHKSPSSRFCFRFHFHCQLHFFILLNKPFFKSCSFLQRIYKCSIFLLLLVVGFLNNADTNFFYTFVAIFQVSHAILPLHGSSLQMFSVTLSLANQTNI